MTLSSFIEKISQGLVLSSQEMADAVRAMMQGEISEPEMEEFLGALADRGEGAAEIIGAASVLREKVHPIKAPPGAVDCCGTGGDGSHTYNISTAVALIAAACGVPVAKHGNRAASSRSGAADVLESLGVNLNAPQETLERALSDIGFCFLMAPHHHQAMKHVGPVRKKMGRRTIFNLLGPLANPAGTKRQLIGVFDPKWMEPIAQTLQSLGSEKAWIVHGSDGLDEITLTGPTALTRLENGAISTATLTPDDFGLPTITLDDITGGDADKNAAALTDLLAGKDLAYRAIALANAAAVLVIADKAATLKDGVSMAAQAIDDGRAKAILDQYITLTNESKN